MRDRRELQLASGMARSLLLCAAMIALLVLAFGGVAAASAGPLEDAKAAGWLGERPGGYVGLVRSDAPAPIRALASEVNAERARRYDEIAQRNGTTPVAVGILAGNKLIDRTPPGQYVMDDQGRWQIKPR